MKLTNVKEVEEFLDIVNKCSGKVWLESIHGDIYNLKSKLSQYIAMAELINQHGEDLELYCSDYNDEVKFVKFFNSHPEI